MYASDANKFPPAKTDEADFLVFHDKEIFALVLHLTMKFKST